MGNAEGIAKGKNVVKHGAQNSSGPTVSQIHYFSCGEKGQATSQLS